MTTGTVQTRAPGFRYRAEILRVIDGDTVVLLIDLGFDIKVKKTCRLAGVNCPEKNTKNGQEARRFTERWFSGGLDCLVETFKSGREKFGRYLAKIHNADGRSLGDELIAAGLATKYMENGHGDGSPADSQGISGDHRPTLAGE